MLFPQVAVDFFAQNVAVCIILDKHFPLSIFWNSPFVLFLQFFFRQFPGTEGQFLDCGMESFSDGQCAAFHHSLESGTILAFRSHIRVRNETEGGLVALEQVQLVLVPAGTQRGHRVLQTDGLQAQRIRSAFHDDEILCIPQSKGAVDAKHGFSLGVEHAGGGIDVLGGIRIGTDVTGRIGNDASPPVPYRNHDPFAEHGVTGAVLLPFEHAQFKQQFLFQSFLLTEIAEGVAVFRGIS